MKNLDKELKKFSVRERKEIGGLLEKILKQSFKGVDCRKLKGFKDIFRVRKGRIRIIFRLESQNPTILAIERRLEDTYKF